LRVTRPGYQAYGNRCPRAADATSFKMAEREGFEGYDIFSVFFGFIDFILAIIPSKINALHLIEESRKAREGREEKEISRSRGMLSPILIRSQVSQVMLRSNCA